MYMNFDICVYLPGSGLVETQSDLGVSETERNSARILPVVFPNSNFRIQNPFRSNHPEVGSPDRVGKHRLKYFD